MDLKDNAPTTAVDEFGRFRFGSYRTPVYNPDFSGADLSDVHPFWGRGDRRGLSGWVRAMRLRQWHYVSLSCEEYLLVAAITHFGTVCNAYCCILEKDTGTRHDFERSTTFGRNVAFADSSVRGTTSWRDGNDYMTFEYQPQHGGLWSLTFNLPFTPKERLKGQVSVHPEAECLCMLFPFGSNRAAYTHKEAGNAAEGLLTFGMQEMRFEHDAQAAIDWSRMFPDRHMKWNWLSVAGISGDGRRVGINISEHMYGGSENYCWLDGVLHPLGVVEFTPPADEGLPWRISSDRCALEFHPDGRRGSQIVGQFVKMNTIQRFGHVEGHVRFGGGVMQVSGLYGVCEAHDAIW